MIKKEEIKIVTRTECKSQILTMLLEIRSPRSWQF